MKLNWKFQGGMDIFWNHRFNDLFTTSIHVIIKYCFVHIRVQSTVYIHLPSDLKEEL